VGGISLLRQGLATMTPEEFWSILHAVPEVPPITHRLYYDDHGNPLLYTMEDLPGNYIDIDSETFFIGSYDVKVVNGQLVQHKRVTSKKLVPGTNGTACHPNNILLVGDYDAATKWMIKTYESNN
jgi:hypothetical protein